MKHKKNLKSVLWHSRKKYKSPIAQLQEEADKDFFKCVDQMIEKEAKKPQEKIQVVSENREVSLRVGAQLSYESFIEILGHFQTHLRSFQPPSDASDASEVYNVFMSLRNFCKVFQAHEHFSLLQPAIKRKGSFLLEHKPLSEFVIHIVEPQELDHHEVVLTTNALTTRFNFAIPYLKSDRTLIDFLIQKAEKNVWSTPDCKEEG